MEVIKNRTHTLVPNNSLLRLDHSITRRVLGPCNEVLDSPLSGEVGDDLFRSQEAWQAAVEVGGFTVPGRVILVTRIVFVKVYSFRGQAKIGVWTRKIVAPSRVEGDGVSSTTTTDLTQGGTKSTRVGSTLFTFALLNRRCLVSVSISVWCSGCLEESLVFRVKGRVNFSFGFVYFLVGTLIKKIKLKFW